MKLSITLVLGLMFSVMVDRAEAAYFGQTLRTGKGGTGSSAQSANRAVETNGSGNLVSSSVTATELGYLSGVTGSIQSQLNASGDVSGKVNRSGDTMTGGLGLIYGGVSPATAIMLDADSKIVSSSVSSTELGYVDGVTAALQGQIDAKASIASVTAKVNRSGDTMTGGFGLDYSGVTASTAVILDGSKKLVSSSVTATELGYVSGVTSPIQSQLAGKLNRLKNVADPGDSDYTIDDTDDYVRQGSALSQARDWTLPACAGPNVGETHILKHSDSAGGFAINVLPNGSDTIDGASSLSLSYPDSVTVVCGDVGKWDVN